jgi:hypothetical protein
MPVYQWVTNNTGEGLGGEYEWGQICIELPIEIIKDNPPPPPPGGDPPNQYPKLTKEQKDKIRERLEDTLKKEKCADFLKKALKNLKSPHKDILEVWDAFSRGDRIYDTGSAARMGGDRYRKLKQ